jgi:hypothetical protein
MAARSKRERLGPLRSAKSGYWWSPDAVEGAMEIIAPDPDCRDECREAVEDAFAAIKASRANIYFVARGHGVARAKPHTKADKAAARDLGAALRRLRYVLMTHKDALGPGSGFYMIPKIDEVGKWIGTCDEQARAPATRKARDEPWKREAARLALELLQEFSSREPTVTAKGQFNRLVGALLGNPTGDHTFVCRQTLKERAQPGPT